MFVRILVTFLVKHTKRIWNEIIVQLPLKITNIHEHMISLFSLLIEIFFVKLFTYIAVCKCNFHFNYIIFTCKLSLFNYNYKWIIWIREEEERKWKMSIFCMGKTPINCKRIMYLMQVKISVQHDDVMRVKC